MDDIDYGALFGIDAEAAEVTEPAEPSGDTTAQGANEQEPAEPAAVEEQIEETNAERAEDGGRSTGGDSPEGQADGQKQTPEQNAKFAAARRKAEAERDAAIAKARQDAQAEAQRTIDEAFRSSGLTNPYTKKPITSKAEYDEYRARLEADRKARLLKKSGMSDEEFQQFVQGLPEVKQAKEAQAAAETAARQAREQQAKLKVEEQLKEISALDPSIQELKDLAKMETYPKFYELVKRGNTLTDAFKLANYDALTGRAAAASRQAAINSAQGKQHLSPTTQRGAGAVSVPADIKAEYLAFNPDATDAEIQQHYNRYMKNHKK
ncbi:hypothetical protein NE670_12585 [Flavonifractor plautii]|uniref:hypothetical protein n=1 Tax=Flavonifractor plautii TaxID=292800 RepID=UPI00210AE074|nr:hypothetical protein [Flavonifractor plautii]MCQ4786095.1 hypothetical protein [Flavonifractor plautii]